MRRVEDRGSEDKVEGDRLRTSAQEKVRFRRFCRDGKADRRPVRWDSRIVDQSAESRIVIATCRRADTVDDDGSSLLALSGDVDGGSFQASVGSRSSIEASAHSSLPAPPPIMIT